MAWEAYDTTGGRGISKQLKSMIPPGRRAHRVQIMTPPPSRFMKPISEDCVLILGGDGRENLRGGEVDCD